jgi:hypothetical protein
MQAMGSSPFTQRSGQGTSHRKKTIKLRRSPHVEFALAESPPFPIPVPAHTCACLQTSIHVPMQVRPAPRQVLADLETALQA